MRFLLQTWFDNFLIHFILDVNKHLKPALDLFAAKIINCWLLSTDNTISEQNIFEEAFMFRRQ